MPVSRDAEMCELLQGYLLTSTRRLSRSEPLWAINSMQVMNHGDNKEYYKMDQNSQNQNQHPILHASQC